MQYANNGSLLSYLSRNINMLTWKMKLNCLMNIARNLSYIHRKGLVHCNLHGRNIVLHNGTPFICDLGSSRSMKLREPNSNIRGDIPFIAPEVFHTRKFTQKSDVYSFGIIMYLMATGEPPFRNRKFDASLIRNIMDGLRPQLPASTPEEYRKLAKRCWDPDPDKRPENGKRLFHYIYKLIKEMDRWNVVYHK